MREHGIIFDLQRSSLRDGPGIRTTVFLKGCPLSCEWCHNPEAISPARQLFFAADRCVQCRACETACPNGVHLFVAGTHRIDFASCVVRGNCVEACHTRSLKIVGRDATVDEIVAVVLADSDFYRASGGGITLSGGEPLFQFSFALALLQRCRALGVHTCVETCGHVRSDRLIAALPYIDVLLFDYKLTSAAEHRQFTGVSNTQILANLALACQAGVAIILRCPIIPGVNDSDAHFRGIRELDLKYPRLAGIELLPYHCFGRDKRPGIGGAATFPDLRSTPPEVSQQWLARLRAMGCEKVTLG